MSHVATAPSPAIDFTAFTNTEWKLDPSHSNVQFTVRHLVSRVSGTFSGVAGTLHQGGADLRGSVVDIVIDKTTVNTGSPDRDNHLRSADFFDAAVYPTMKFHGAEFIPTGDDTFDVKGTLTIRNVELPVVLHAIDSGRIKDGWGNLRAGFQATTVINRHDFGLNWNMALEAGGMMVGEKVTITLDVQFVWQGAGTAN